MGQNASHLDITVKFVMAGKADIKVRVLATSTVRELKAIIAEKSDIFPENQLLLYKDNELKDYDAKIAGYGIVTNCTVTMSTHIITGKSAATNLATIFYVPVSLPQDTGGLRTTVKTMTTVKSRRVEQELRPKEEERLPLSAVGAQHTWTPEKRLEIELTRNRMKALMRRKNKTKLLSPTATPSDHGSIISSRLHTPPNEPTNISKAILTPPNSRESPAPMTPEEEIDVSDRELKLFFEPMETFDQLKRSKRKAMVPPPQNGQELEEIKKRVELTEKTTCKMCGKKIPAVEQVMRCRCKLLFCRQHRDPKNHLCKIDYKQTGRTKINKWMPKIGDGGMRKGKPDLEGI